MTDDSAIAGAGGFGREVIDVVDAINSAASSLHIGSSALLMTVRRMRTSTGFEQDLAIGL